MIQVLRPDKQSHQDIVIVLTGDIILDEPNPDYWLSGIAPALTQADVVIGHLEVPHTLVSQSLIDDIPAPGSDPQNLKALKNAGFSVMTMAGNHIADCGAQGIQDTCTELKNLGITYCGAGENLTKARKPAEISRGNRTVAVLSYNCVGPESAWANTDRAGCAYLPVITENNEPINPRVTIKNLAQEAYDILKKDITSLREKTDFIIVALHKGIVHTPTLIAPYEKEIAHAAIDAGADLVIGHHAHIVRGIEFYKGKPIYHGLGNGCVVTRALNDNQSDPKRSEWAKQRKIMFGFEPDPQYYLAPFHPEAVNAFLARIVLRADNSVEAGIVPVFIDPPGRPRLANTLEATQICEYVKQITTKADFTELQMLVREDMVVFT